MEIKLFHEKTEIVPKIGKVSVAVWQIDVKEESYTVKGRVTAPSVVGCFKAESSRNKANIRSWAWLITRKEPNLAFSEAIEKAIAKELDMFLAAKLEYIEECIEAVKPAEMAAA